MRGGGGGGVTTVWPHLCKEAALVLTPDGGCVVDKEHALLCCQEGAGVVVVVGWTGAKERETPVDVVCTECLHGPRRQITAIKIYFTSTQ